MSCCRPCCKPCGCLYQIIDTSKPLPTPEPPAPEPPAPEPPKPSVEPIIGERYTKTVELTRTEHLGGGDFYSVTMSGNVWHDIIKDQLERKPEYIVQHYNKTTQTWGTDWTISETGDYIIEINYPDITVEKYRVFDPTTNTVLFIGELALHTTAPPGWD